MLDHASMFLPSPLPRTLEASLRDIGSTKASVRVSAIGDLVRHAARSDDVRARAIPLLEKTLRDDEAAPARGAAAVALADMGAHEALATLLVAVEDDDDHVRQMALSALGEIGDPRASQRLERAMRDPRPEVRYQAVIAYSRVCKDDPAALAAALTRALDDADAAIRYIAMRLAEERLADVLAVSSEAVPAPFREGSLAHRIDQLVDSPDEATAVVAGLYLARLGRQRGYDVVLDVVAERRKTPELEDERACVELAGELLLRDALPHLERRVWGSRRVLRTFFSWGAGDHSSCSWHARIALARMGHEAARAGILADLSSWRRETREAAVVAAGRARVAEARSAIENLGGSVDAALVREALVRLAVG